MRNFDLCFGEDSSFERNIWGMNWRAYMIKRADQAINILDEVVNEHNLASVLEIGCASGDFTARILNIKKGVSVTGVDISKKAIDICKRRFCSIENAQFINEALPRIQLEPKEMIVCMDVLHYYTPIQWKECLKNISLLSDRNGYVLIQVPILLLKGSENELITLFSECFTIDRTEYVYGQIWYDLIEKRLQPLVQITYIEHHSNSFYRACGWVGYNILKSRLLVDLFFAINKWFFKNMPSHLIIVGRNNE